MRKELKNYNQKFKIFGRKKGRKFVKNLNTELPKENLLNIPSDLIEKNIILDIGSGNGENAIFLSHKYSDHLIIASDSIIISTSSFVILLNPESFNLLLESLPDLVPINFNFLTCFLFIQFKAKYFISCINSFVKLFLLIETPINGGLNDNGIQLFTTNPEIIFLDFIVKIIGTMG